MHTHLELSCETEMDFKIMLIGQFFLANQKFLKWTNEEPAFLNPRLDNLIFLRHIFIDLVNIQDGSGRLGEKFSEFLVGEPNFNLLYTNEYIANPNKIYRTDMRLDELHFELRES